MVSRTRGRVAPGAELKMTLDKTRQDTSQQQDHLKRQHEVGGPQLRPATNECQPFWALQQREEAEEEEEAEQEADEEEADADGENNLCEIAAGSSNQLVRSHSDLELYFSLLDKQDQSPSFR